MNNFNIEITSVEDRNNLVAEIWYLDNLIVEINIETQIPKITLYNSNTDFSIDEFMNQINKAIRELTSRSNSVTVDFDALQ